VGFETATGSQGAVIMKYCEESEIKVWATRRACPVCSSSHTNVIDELWDDRFGQPDVFHLRYCVSCDFAFLEEVMTDEGVPSLYAAYYQREESVDLGSWRRGDSVVARAGRWLDGNCNPVYGIATGERVLDVGCGTGDLLASCGRRGAIAEGLDPDPKAALEARRRGWRVYEGTLETCRELLERSYDRIILNQVLEHIPDPVKTLERCRSLLTAKGKVVIVSPHLNSCLRAVTGSRWVQWHAPYHVSHFSRTALTRASEKARLTLQSFAVVSPGNWLLMQLSVRTRAKRGVPRARFRVSFPLWQRLLVAPVGRLLDGVGRGECFVATLLPSRREIAR
jgi:2-polyprenyl-3-methyl-5-hydroxy-6-metoxy-1,4-benzoquinol methylase